MDLVVLAAVRSDVVAPRAVVVETFVARPQGRDGQRGRVDVQLRLAGRDAALFTLAEVSVVLDLKRRAQLFSHRKT